MGQGKFHQRNHWSSTHKKQYVRKHSESIMIENLGRKTAGTREQAIADCESATIFSLRVPLATHSPSPHQASCVAIPIPTLNPNRPVSSETAANSHLLFILPLPSNSRKVNWFFIRLSALWSEPHYLGPLKLGNPILNKQSNLHWLVTRRQWRIHFGVFFAQRSRVVRGTIDSASWSFDRSVEWIWICR